MDTLGQFISENRPALDSIVTFYGIREKHKNYKVTKNIYSGAWDGTIFIRALKSGTYAMVTP